ncbi:alpha/beta hydrolase [Azohydromonas aeria]|uniref:alpha/beta hydrolase n=1 Tax=Azohydromonas aeria TaxID=2590212 RepID=UPI0012F8B8A0|nr:alpha/beta hydrolase [Azohydromonas aeria]
MADVVYGSLSPAQRLDLYRPATGKGPWPVVVYVHGGGFRFGERTMASAALVKSFLQAGYAVASVDYRLSGEAPFPAAVQDVFSAVAHIKRQATALQLDASRLVMFGESAGANLASLVGTAHDEPLFRQLVPTQDLDLRPTAVVAHYPPVDFSRIDSMLRAQGCNPAQINHDRGDSFESAYLGAALPTVPDRVARANPATYASAGDSRFLVQNGDSDCNVGSGQAAILVDALRKAGVTVSHDVLPGAGHGGPQFETEVNIARILAFLRS